MEKKILIVHEEAAVRKMLAETFQEEGYKAITADSAESALEILPSERCLLLFLGACLPGMSGVELCRHVKAEYPLAICYALAADTCLFELSECREAGFDDYYCQPTNVALLQKAAQEGFEKIDRWMRR